MATSRGVEWLAGILEGEGTFTLARNRPVGRPMGSPTPWVTVTMTDRDVVVAAASVIETVGGRPRRISSRALPSGKTAYRVDVTGLPAVRVMLAVLPFMGVRRGSVIRCIVADWNPRKYREAVALKNELTGRQGTLT